MAEQQGAKEKKEYFPPKVVHTERMETRAVVCAMADDSCSNVGPLQS